MGISKIRPSKVGRLDQIGCDTPEQVKTDKLGRIYGLSKEEKCKTTSFSGLFKLFSIEFSI